MYLGTVNLHNTTWVQSEKSQRIDPFPEHIPTRNGTLVYVYYYNLKNPKGSLDVMPFGYLYISSLILLVTTPFCLGKRKKGAKKLVI